jgi:MFS family permease
MTLPALRAIGGGTGAPRAWDRIGAATGLAAGAGLLLAGLGAAPLLAVALVLGGAVIGLPALQRLLPAGTLRALPGMPAAIITSGLLNLAFFGVDAFVPLGLTEARGQSATMAGLALTAATLTWTAGSWLQARLAPSEGRRQLTSAGLLVLAAGCAGGAIMVLPSAPIVIAPLAWGIAGLGMGIAYSTLSLVVLEDAVPGEEGSATAALQLMNVLGSALGAGIGGAIIAQAGASSANVGAALIRQDLLMIAALAIGLLTAQRLPGRQRIAAESQAFTDETATVAGR